MNNGFRGTALLSSRKDAEEFGVSEMRPPREAEKSEEKFSSLTVKLPSGMKSDATIISVNHQPL
ncbi:MAG: hypothetical protein ACK40X_08815 [Armatimonadota bacterium]